MKAPETFEERRPTFQAMQFTGDNYRDIRKWVRDAVPDAKLMVDAADAAAADSTDFVRIAFEAGRTGYNELPLNLGDWLVQIPSTAAAQTFVALGMRVSPTAPFAVTTDDVLTSVFQVIPKAAKTSR